jgi:DNA invertase Pin-like site-specific DNA recombinase
MRTIAYGVKSSPDEKGAVADQHAQVLEAIKREGDRDDPVVFGEENQSGYRKERGPELAAAIKLAYRLADEGHDVEFWVWHSSRLARGTGRKGGRRALGKLLYDLQERGVTVRSVDDNEFTTNEQLWGIASRQSSKYSEDLSGWVKRGIRVRRDEEHKPVGPVPFGYRVEPELDADGKIRLDRKQKVINRRVPDPKAGPLRVELRKRIAAKASPGSVARWLNEKGVTTARGKPFNEKTVVQIVRSDVDEGGKGYPALVTPELAQASRDGLERMDPVAVQQRHRGRRADDSYVLRQISHCRACGEPHYATAKWLGGSPGYVCKNKARATGLCNPPPIPAELLETHVLSHLDCFVDGAEKWIAGVLAERDGERQVHVDQLDQEKATLAGLDRQRSKRMAELKSVGFHPVALEAIEELDQQREAQASVIADRESVLAEWAPTPGVDEALDYYNGLVEQIRGRVRKASGARELNETLASVLAGLWCEIRDGRLIVEFELRDQPTVFMPDDPVLPGERADRDWLPPVELSTFQRPKPRSKPRSGSRSSSSRSSSRASRADSPLRGATTVPPAEPRRPQPHERRTDPGCGQMSEPLPRLAGVGAGNSPRAPDE